MQIAFVQQRLENGFLVLQTRFEFSVSTLTFVNIIYSSYNTREKQRKVNVPIKRLFALLWPHYPISMTWFVRWKFSIPHEKNSNSFPCHHILCHLYYVYNIHVPWQWYDKNVTYLIWKNYGLDNATICSK